MIVVFGSINLDFTATVDRLPNPGETRIGHSFSMTPGGKGANQALAAAAIVVTLPVLLLTIFIQKEIVAGLTAGGVKA